MGILKNTKEALANMRFLKQSLSSSKSSLTADDLDAAYQRLNASIEDASLSIDLEAIKDTASKGIQMSWWSRRFLFGFGVANAIDDWFDAFDNADVSKPILARIPRNETSNVAAKWLWFLFFTSLIGVVFSLAVAAITASFLYQQTKVLSKQAEIFSKQEAHARKTDTNAQRTQYTQILYDERCESTTVESDSSNNADLAETKHTCEPVYNFRIRSEAVAAFLTLETNGHDAVDLTHARLEKASLSNFNFRYVDLSYANLREANLRDSTFDVSHLSYTDLTDAFLTNTNLAGSFLNEANLTRATLSSADLTKANLEGAILSGASMFGTTLIQANLKNAELVGVASWYSNYSQADLNGANLASAELKGANFSGADLTDANLTKANLVEANLTGALLVQSQLDQACGDNSTQLPVGLTIASC